MCDVVKAMSLVPLVQVTCCALVRMGAGWVTREAIVLCDADWGGAGHSSCNGVWAATLRVLQLMCCSCPRWQHVELHNPVGCLWLAAWLALLPCA
jgi:hypothetical protein